MWVVMVKLQLLVQLAQGTSAPGGRIRHESIEFSAPTLGQELCFRIRGEQLGVKEMIPEAADVDEVEQSSYDSAKPFSHGDPGSM
jgi:hypothetical protein